ncbi:GbsR/MarR family transcriptional regulator [Nocardia arthritidis]|nr:helix-turn-helix domain-containing protein [Nocardia arthritidis]
MPGSRLTHRDRRAIAEGLAADLSYTEIAKRLDRPTSTVTREVMRNGGPNDYRPDRAQRAAQQRTRRRRNTTTAPPRTPVAHVPGRDPEAVEEFTARLTELLTGTGMPRMTAAVLSCLYTTDTGSLSSAELVDRLRVSPASISKAVGYLENQELIRRTRDAGRRDRYVIDDDVWLRATLASARMNEVLADVARDGVDVFGAATPAGARLLDMGNFLNQVCRDLIRTAEQWRHTSGSPVDLREEATWDETPSSGS